MERSPRMASIHLSKISQTALLSSKTTPTNFISSNNTLLPIKSPTNKPLSTSPSVSQTNISTLSIFSAPIQNWKTLFAQLFIKYRSSMNFLTTIFRRKSSKDSNNIVFSIKSKFGQFFVHVFSECARS